MSDEEQGFVIRDRRGRGESPASGETQDPPTAPSQPAEAPASDFAQDAHIPANFSSFVISMGSSALMLMGEQLSPQQPSLPVNLPQAKARGHARNGDLDDEACKENHAKRRQGQP